MYQSKEALKDFHLLLIAISIIVALIVGVYTWSHLPTGLKYKLLKEYGITAEATVVDIAEIKSLDDGKEVQFLTGFSSATSEYLFQFKDRDNKIYNPKVFLGETSEKNEETGKWVRVHRFQENQKVPILYLSYWPQVFYPETLIEDLNFDWNFLWRGLLVFFATMTFIFWRTKKFMDFRRRQKRY